MEKEEKNNLEETTKKQKLPVNKIFFAIWFIINWSIFVGLFLLYYSIFGGNEGQITSDAWTGAPNAHYYPPPSPESRIAGIVIAAAFNFAGIVKRIAKINAMKNIHN